MDYTKKLAYRSNYWYNDGLKKANIRDLTGAIISLRRSLQYNRENIMARNLLGLVYYGRGEVVEALVQWIISKNFKSYENIANYYIKKVQESSGELDTINQAIHKYNQCLAYCKQNGEDLAIIQLKKVIQAHPNYLKAHQLLTLLYMHTGQLSKARQLVRKAYKMDITNPITLNYMHELTQVRGEKVAKLKEDKDSREQTVTYNLGNETIIQPVSSSLKDNAAVLTILNIVIGIGLGAAIVWFLIMPAANQKKTLDNNRTIIEMSEQISSQNTLIGTLKEELNAFRETNDEAETALETATSVKSSYEALMYAYDLYQSRQSTPEEMSDVLLTINPESLGDNARPKYDSISGEIYPKVIEGVYNSAKTELEGGNFQNAVDGFEKVIKMNSAYENGMALKLLGDAYKGLENVDKAAEIYTEVVEGYPDTEAATAASEAMAASTEE